MYEFKTLDQRSKQWFELYVCSSCGQHWMVEKGAEMDRRANKAFKIPDPDNWLSHDIRPALADWLIDQHGGLSNQQCAFSGCEKTALRNMAVCVEHGHSEYQWSQSN